MVYEKVNKSEEMVDFATVFNLLNYSTDEIFILDAKTDIIYVNKKCESHYGLHQEDILGMNNDVLVKKGYWKPSIVPLVIKEKKAITIKQQTYLGKELLTRAIPVLNDKNEIDYIFISSTEIKSITKTFISNRTRQKQDTYYSSSYPKMITNNYKMKELYRFCERIAPTGSTVLIHGESGTGKNHLAHYLHQISDRSHETFMTVNCAALPHELIESELFGYEKGAFTGATEEGKVGLFKTADKGTIFLDEISEIDISVQAKLLQVIQEKSFRPVGSNETIHVDVRIIAATNKDLKEKVAQKKFREDLFYRLSVIELQLPSLRERGEDILPFIYQFLTAFNEKYDTNKVISESCIQLLKTYSWPGNIRQLENVIERLVIIGEDIIQESDLPTIILEEGKNGYTIESDKGLDFALENLTSLIVKQSHQTHKSTRKVAEDLNISQSRASRLIRKYC